MGISRARVHYEKGLPSFVQIQKRFKKQTGLDINIDVYLNLIEIPLSSKHVVEKLSQDIDKYEQSERHDINYINQFSFFNSRFYRIDFYVKEKTINLEYRIDGFYFGTSLLIVLLDLGGKLIVGDNQILNELNITKRLKKLKHWEDYKWYNRPKK